MTYADNIVIGAGPAGLFAALNIHKGTTLVLEKNNHAGRKLLITGSGRCNFTHDGPLHDFFGHYRPDTSFLKPALKQFGNTQLRKFFSDHGMNSYADEKGKIFPINNQAGSLLEILLNTCKQKNVRLLTNNGVNTVKYNNGNFELVTGNAAFRCKRLIIACGGKSYPSTGSSGDGYTIAASLGHHVVEPVTALSPVFIRQYAWAGLAGISLKDAELSIFREGKKLFSCREDLLFTHKGLSGPVILDHSGRIRKGDTISINTTGQNAEEFRQQLIIAAQNEGKVQIGTYLKKYNIARSLSDVLLKLAGIKYDMKLAELSKENRKLLCATFCNFSMTVDRKGGFDVAMLTAGGVSLSEVSAKTMESKIIPNLYFAGEVLDIDGDTGGYNLQAAFSTAWLAANSINHKY